MAHVGRHVCAMKLQRDVALSLVSTKRQQWKHIVALSCHFGLFANFEQVCAYYISCFDC